MANNLLSFNNIIILINREIRFEYKYVVRSQSIALTLKFNKIQKVELIDLASIHISAQESFNFCWGKNFKSVRSRAQFRKITLKRKIISSNILIFGLDLKCCSN